ncbi:hypothetical protein AMJ39_06270 [candidate division TA06 bacterium DG_24]|uniref:Deoxyhypusine synthase n=3 Tax=Bacteria division TA06 TaxID=1156500 RepID=A0A0S8JMX1_UNCT6|nr:MAG: hypothetical protein AMJ39_06270 [candidate division TA06 bacterium DG_24]KPK69807.1 MAG: hypothetical protein AMJ82_04775 [candidate division TA06 bacterium SM23_40]KPL10172.1 MAG: hypothetical protein AMJ71_04090 [candidate division TA06 bacterium SM1_40]
MPSRYEEIDLSQVHRISIDGRASKVTVDDFAKSYAPDEPISGFFDALPSLLAAAEFRRLVGEVGEAIVGKRTVLMLLGAHVVKCGLSPVLLDLAKRGAVTAFALTGAGAIHDFEIAMWGKTSEDVAAGIVEGSFGMAKETGQRFNEATNRGAAAGLGLGEALGKWIVQQKAVHGEASLLAGAYELGIPVTVHVAIGTDIVHQHPEAEGAAIGQTTLRDFRIFANVVAGLHRGAVLNVGSAVVLPEVFIKALSLARNTGHTVDDFTAANFDMIRHYRPQENVLNRPTGGRGIMIIGHHELMIPLYAAALKSWLAERSEREGGGSGGRPAWE